MCQDILKAYILNQDDWDEIRRREGKDAGEPYVVPSTKNKVISIRFPEIYHDQEVLILVRKPKEKQHEVT